ncbi:MAG TPA: hypothetical protein VNZ86_07385 [Bacteroidia bacterium]|jgi:hypothetical protein|nr:hypothetical protein [Bacteroidia bacterium]
MGLERKKKEDLSGKASKNISWTDALGKKFPKPETEELPDELKQEPEKPQEHLSKTAENQELGKKEQA